VGESPDQLREEIAQKREDAARKLGALEAELEAKIEQVETAYDPRRRIAARPWLSVGAALLAGFALGWLTAGDRLQSPPRQGPSSSLPTRLLAAAKRVAGTV